ncbi:6537_t:CDS:2, partial [Racocetra fulgida]
MYRERKCHKARTNANLQQESERPVISVNIESIHPIGENISTSSQIENINNTSENEEIIIATSQNDNIAEINENRVIDTVNYQTLNENQQKVFKRIEIHYQNILSGFQITLTTHIKEKYNRTECDRFLNAMFILPKWSEVDTINLNKLEFLKNPVVKVLAKYTSDQEAKKADSDVAKGLEAQLLLAKNARTEARLVNGSIGTIYDILYNENGPPFLLVAVFIAFDNYNGPAIRILE